jgi:hypothetical protein
MVWMVVAVFAFTGTAQAYEVARVMTSGKVNVYRNGQLSQVLQESAPLPDGALLKPQGDCTVRLENLYMLARDGSEFGVHNDSRPVQLALNKGTVYFAVNQSTGQMVFHTPAGSITTQQFRIQAAASATLQGFIDVANGNTVLGVIEGGAMMVSTPDGEQLITSGKQIVLAQADILDAKETGDAAPAEAPAKPATTSGKIPTKYLVGGALGALAIGAGALALGSSGGSSGSSPAPASPATP